MQHGKFFVIDGGDGSGKATQAKLLAPRLAAESAPVASFAFPRYDTPTGRVIRQKLQGRFGDPTKMDARIASAFFAADRLAAASEISAALASGRHVIADRYVAANGGHQGSKMKDDAARAEYLAWLDQYEYGENGIPRPDLNIILHVPAEMSLQLIQARGAVTDLHESLDHLKAAEQSYLWMAAHLPGFAVVECVEAGRLLSPEQVHAKVWEAVCTVLDINLAATQAVS